MGELGGIYGMVRLRSTLSNFRSVTRHQVVPYCDPFCDVKMIVVNEGGGMAIDQITSLSEGTVPLLLAPTAGLSSSGGPALATVLLPLQPIRHSYSPSLHTCGNCWWTLCGNVESPVTRVCTARP